MKRTNQSLPFVSKVAERKKTRGKPAFRERGETADKAKLFANSKNEQKASFDEGSDILVL